VLQPPTWGVPILVTFYDIHGLQWDYSLPRSPHGKSDNENILTHNGIYISYMGKQECLNFLRGNVCCKASLDWIGLLHIYFYHYFFKHLHLKLQKPLCLGFMLVNRKICWLPIIFVHILGALEGTTVGILLLPWITVFILKTIYV
jgi:hypothetical protein